MLGNRYQAEAAIKEKLGADTIVNHKVAIFFTVVSEVDGKMGKRECCNRYIFFNCGYCGCAPCKDTTATAENAAEVAGGAPGTAVMERSARPRRAARGIATRGGEPGNHEAARRTARKSWPSGGGTSRPLRARVRRARAPYVNCRDWFQNSPVL